MKTVLMLLSFGLLLTGVQIAHAEDFSPAIIIHSPENAFAPMGFDDNDNAQVVLFGNLPSTCHKAGPVRYRVDKEKNTIFIRNEIYFYSGSWCAQVLIPYLQTVNVGILRSGNYDVAVEKEDGSFEKMARMPVAVARTSSPDDYLYAPVDQAHFTRVTATEPTLTLSGTFTNSCMRLVDIRLNYRPNHVIEVLPIAEMDKEGCVPASRPFEASVKLNPSLHGRALIHVRSLSGQALNQVVEL